MLLGILSDTHDRLVRPQLALDLLRDAGAEALIHCGDFTSPEVMELLGLGGAGLPTWIVFGNNDSGRTRELERAAKECGATSLGRGGVVTLADRTIAVTHGHLTAERKRLVALEPSYLLTGHSHRKQSERVGPTHHINPGALHRAREFTVAMLDLEQDAVSFITVEP